MPLTLSVMMRTWRERIQSAPQGSQRRRVYTAANEVPAPARAALSSGRGAAPRSVRRRAYNRRAQPRQAPELTDFRQDFLAFSLARDVLRFGEFVTKAGRQTPYFFNAGLFNDGASLRRLGQFYAEAALESGVGFDQLFGPAYKGITLAAATAVALAEKGHNLPFSFNRKEIKDHGEGGNVIGAPLSGRVLIVDDVISAGTSVRESVDLIRAHGATPAGVLIALDRMERGTGEKSGVQEVRETYGIPVVAIATLDDLLQFIAGRPALTAAGPAVTAYRERYGVH